MATEPAGRRSFGAIALALVLPSAAFAAGEEKVFDLDISGGQVPVAQRLIRVQKEDQVRWRITSDTAGELHVHGYRLEARVAAGVATDFAFKAFATGRFRLEWHAAKGSAGAGAGHHGPPLATLEVRPR